MEADGRVMHIDVDKLKPHPRNEDIYGEESIEDLVVQIEAYGGLLIHLKSKKITLLSLGTGDGRQPVSWA